jgi:hypothetical protein
MFAGELPYRTKNCNKAQPTRCQDELVQENKVPPYLLTKVISDIVKWLAKAKNFPQIAPLQSQLQELLPVVHRKMI